MPARINRLDDFHVEAAGPVVLGPIPSPFVAQPAATQEVVCVGDEPLLRDGDAFDNEGPTHKKPMAGTAFVNPAGVTGKGKFTDAGQQVFFVNARPVMTLAGRLETCSDAVRETGAAAAVILGNQPVLFVDGQPVLPGRK